MTATLRRTMAWVHGWLGLVAGWILFAMFLTGTASYFRPEITRWMQPELPAYRGPPAEAAASAQRTLERVGRDDVQWFITLPDARTPVTRVFEQGPAAPGAAPAYKPELVLDPATGAPVHARDTRGGEHFYRFHFQLQLPYPWGRLLAGVCGFFMLGAIVSGVITHKRIFTDFFTLRWNKGQRSWLDAHNASAVLALPYHLVITWTGIMTLIALYLPQPIAANYTDPTRFYADSYGLTADAPASGTVAPLVPIDRLVRDAERRMGAPAGRVVVRHPHDAAATVAVSRGTAAAIGARGASITYAGATGAIVAASPDAGPAVRTAGVLLGLHVAGFAGPALRWTLFVLGLAGAAMVGTGLLLWTAARRRPGAAPFLGLRLVERLNIATVAGLPIGMAAFLLANRVIPADMAGRADAEVAAMFWVWGAAALVQLLRPARHAWPALFAVGATLFAAIPVADALTVPQGLARAIAGDDGLFAAFDVAMLALSLLLGFAAWRAACPPTPGRTRRRQEPAYA